MQFEIISKVRFGIAVIFVFANNIFWIDGAFIAYMRYLKFKYALSITLIIEIA